MRLLVNLDLMARNAATVAAIAQRAGWTPVGVIKDGYARAPIVRAFERGGVHDFALSSSQAAVSEALVGIDPARLSLIGLPPLMDVPRVADCVATSTHSGVETVFALAAAARVTGRRHAVLIALRTRECREGVDPRDYGLLDSMLAATAGTPVRVAGVLAHYGCRDFTAPSSAELDDIWSAARHLNRSTGAAPVVSLGGSLLLDELPSPPVGIQCQIRVGEAVFAGTIADRASPTLSTPFALDANVLQVRTDAQRTQVLLDVGVTVFDPVDARLADTDGTIEFASSECAVATLSGGKRTAVGDRVRLSIGWRSAIRALLNPTVPIAWTLVGDPARSLGGLE